MIELELSEPRFGRIDGLAEKIVIRILDYKIDLLFTAACLTLQLLPSITKGIIFIATSNKVVCLHFQIIP